MNPILKNFLIAIGAIGLIFLAVFVVSRARADEKKSPAKPAISWSIADDGIHIAAGADKEGIIVGFGGEMNTPKESVDAKTNKLTVDAGVMAAAVQVSQILAQSRKGFHAEGFRACQQQVQAAEKKKPDEK